jgi:hypothetical protein
MEEGHSGERESFGWDRATTAPDSPSDLYEFGSRVTAVTGGAVLELRGELRAPTRPLLRSTLADVAGAIGASALTGAAPEPPTTAAQAVRS